MKEKSVKNLLSGNKNAAPAGKKKAKGKTESSGKEGDGNTAAPVLPKAKAKDHDKKGKGKGSPEQKKEWPCVFHYIERGRTSQRERLSIFPTTKGRAKAKARVQGLLHRRETESATHGEKESAQRGISANTSTPNQRTPKHPLQHLTPSNKPKHRPSPKQQLRQL